MFDDVFKDRFNWLPLEVMRDKTYSRKSDVYMVAMTAYEMFSALDLHMPSPIKNQLGCIPFAVHRKRMIEDVLSCDEVPERPNCCPEWLYEILRKCWYREKIRRLTITELISQIEERRPLHRKMNDEKFTQVSTNHDQDDLESPPDVPQRRFQQRPLFKSFGGRMSLAPLPLPCISPLDYGERVSGILSVSHVSQFTLGSKYSSSENYPDETDYSDGPPTERRITRFPRAANNTLQMTESSSLSTDQQFCDRNSPVRMRTNRGRYQRCFESSIKLDMEIGKHSLNQNDTSEIERLQRRSHLLSQRQLMDTSSPSMSSQEDVSIHFENNSESDTSSTIHESQGSSSTGYIQIYSRTPSLSTTPNRDAYSINKKTCAKDWNENNHRNSPKKKSKVPTNETTSGNCVKTTNKSSTVPKLTLQNSSTNQESSSSDSNTIHNNSDFSVFHAQNCTSSSESTNEMGTHNDIFHAQNCTSSSESTYEMGTHNDIFRSEGMQINNAEDWSLEGQNDGYLTVLRQSQQE